MHSTTPTTTESEWPANMLDTLAKAARDATSGAKRAEQQTCNTCCRTASNPWRVYDEHGKVTEGCVDDFHTGHLVPISESNRWHNRPQAKTIRRQQAKILRSY